MDSGTLILILLFGFVSASHAIFLKLAAKRKVPKIHQERLWQIYSLVNGSLWLLVFFWTAIVQFTLPRSIAYPPEIGFLGGVLVVDGIFIVVYIFSLIGFGQAMGMRFFFPEKDKRIISGIYRYLKNPMYDGFLFVLLGLAFSLGIREDFYLALASFLFLNVFLARVENYEHSLSPF